MNSSTVDLSVHPAIKEEDAVDNNCASAKPVSLICNKNVKSTQCGDAVTVDEENIVVLVRTHSPVRSEPDSDDNEIKVR